MTRKRAAFELVVVTTVAALGACVGDSPEATGGDLTDGGGVTEGGGADVGATTDGASSTDAGSDADANPACNPNAAFGTALLVPGLPSDVGAVRLSADELSAYFDGRADAGAEHDLFVATRMSRANAFGTAAPVANVNDPTLGEFYPTVTADGQTMAFYRRITPGSIEYELWLAARDAGAQEFSAPAKITGANDVMQREVTPFIVADGSELWFGSQRTGSSGVDLYRAPRVGQSYANPVAQAELNTASVDQAPVLSTDGLTIFWASNRTDGNAKGGYDVWSATRASKTEAFTSLKNVAELNTTETEFPTWLSPDGCRLYLVRGSPLKAYVAERGM